MAISKILLELVGEASGQSAWARVFHVTTPTAAFGRLDRGRPGLSNAVRAVEEAGFAPVLRLGGGHLVLYDAGCIVFELAEPRPRGREIPVIFRRGTTLLSRALRSVGCTVASGERPGEYCPGAWSLHVPAGPKVAGAALRITSTASLFTAVVLVAPGDELPVALQDAYRHLGLPLDPATVGGLAARFAVTTEMVRHALLSTLGDEYQVSPGTCDSDMTERVRRVCASFVLRSSGPRRPTAPI